MRHFILFLLILFLIAAFLRVEFFFTILYLFLAVYLLSHLWARRTLAQLDVHRRFTDHAFFGDLVTVNTVIQNKGLLPIPWLEVHQSLPVQLATPPFHRQAISLGPHETQELPHTLYCRKRGYYRIGPLTLTTGDLLGIGSFHRTEVDPETIIVYPDILPLQQLGLPARAPLAALPAPTALFEDPARVMGVRPYQRGDRLRKIHWTATARTGTLLVKQYQTSIARDTLVCLNLNQNDYGPRQRYTASELAIVAAASIANHIVVREGLPVGLTTEAWDPLVEEQLPFFLPPRSERAHLMSVLEVLARVQITEGRPFSDLLRQQTARLPWGATLAVVTGADSQGLFDTLIYLRRAGFAVALILIQPTKRPGRLQSRAESLGVPVYRVWREQDLEMWR